MVKIKSKSPNQVTLFFKRRKSHIQKINCYKPHRMIFFQPFSVFRRYKIDEGEIVLEIDDDVEHVNIERGKGNIVSRTVRSPFDLHTNDEINKIISLCFV